MRDLSVILCSFFEATPTTEKRFTEVYIWEAYVLFYSLAILWISPNVSSSRYV